MPLKSILFHGDARLEACLLRDSAHVVPGDSGPHVQLVQDALLAIDKLLIDPKEVEAQKYGPSTAAAVHAYKKKRHIINRAYQSKEDNIVGKMTIKSLDDELVKIQGRRTSGPVVARCDNNMPATAVALARTQLPPEGLTRKGERTA